MTPDDPRHGSRRGYYAHRRDGEDACTACKRGAAGWTARYESDRAHGKRAKVASLGSKRRLQALAAMGYTWRALDRHIGRVNMCEKWANESRPHVFASTAAEIASLYDRLSMRFPPETNRHERISVARARSLARRKGWPPPLAWDDIDDPSETPTGWHYIAPDRADALHDMDALHIGVTEACVRLDVRRDNLERWCARRGLGDLYSRLVDRDTPRYWRNGVAEGGAA